ncbi:MAG TPA: TonB-dependent receptor [Croceibacterium sp.]|nr:TonB-dependent receptor [Croceibacterium sp.]
MTLKRLFVSTSSLALSLAATSPALAGEVVGTVVDESDTVALQAASVRLVELNRQAVTGADGSYRFGDVPAGTYTLEARYVGVEPELLTLSVPQTGAARGDFALGGDKSTQILISGLGANQASALSRKRESDVVSDVLTRDAIGQFPDQNVAESLRRLPGVNILNDQGEGRFVSVRGLDPELVSSSVNGVRLPAPEADVRSVALDVISSDIIESIEVKKSLTPDMDADTIGASVEINTTSAFNRRRDHLGVELEGSYNDYSGELTPKGSLDFAFRLSDNVGVSGGASYYKRKFETDNIEADDWTDAGSGPFAATLEYRDYDVERERISGSLNFDFRLGETTELYVRGLYSQFEDQEYRRRTTFDLGDFEDDGPSAVDGTLLSFSDEDQEFTVERDHKDRFETQKIRSISAGGETRVGDWFAEYNVAWAKSSERENGSLDPVAFERDFDGDGLVLGIDHADPRVPMFSILNDPGDFLDPATYALNDVELTALSDSRDEEYSAKLDLGRTIVLDNGEFTVQAGAKGRWREKSYDAQIEFYEHDAFTLADVLGQQTYRLIDMGSVADFHTPRRFFEDNFDQFELQETDSLFDSAVSDYGVDEDILAGYFLGRFDSDTVRIIGGVRYERTANDIRGNSVLLVEEDGTLPDGTRAGEDTVIVTPVAFERDYGHWLPSLNVRVEARPDLVVRGAAYRSLVRPKLSRLAPRFEIEQNDEDEVEGVFGNPDLKPYVAWNFDASVEHYLSSNGALTAGVFYKWVDNFIVDTVREDGTWLGIDFDRATVPINGDGAEIYGLELSFAQQMSMLPEPFDGLLLQANYTYTHATGDVPNDGDPTDPRRITLPATARHTVNGVIGYENGPFSIRLAGTYRDKYLDELGSEAELDRYVDNHFQLDLSAKYRLNRNVQVFYEWINLNNAKYFAYNTLGDRRNLLQYEEYSWTMKGGVKVTF